MLTEDYNGLCPKCNYKRCLVRYGSFGYFQFFACPKCEYAFGDNGVENYDQKEVWKSILEEEGKHIKKAGFEVSINGVKDWVESMPEPKDSFILIEEKTCFSYKVEPNKKNKDFVIKKLKKK